MSSYRIISNDNNGPVVFLIVNKEMAQSTDFIYDSVCHKIKGSFVLCEILVDSWGSLLTPWKAEEVQESFSGNASCLLDYIKDIINCENDLQGKDCYVAGYSLAGLFSLWALYESNLFIGCISCSGSLWYPGWKEYVMAKAIDKPVSIYMSLGTKEERTNNMYMKHVGDNTRYMDEIFKVNSCVTDYKFEWNTGGHFTDVSERIIKGISWIIKH